MRGVSERRFTKAKLLLGVLWGLAAALITSVVAVAQYMITDGRAFDTHGITLGKVIALYFIGGIVGGAIVGLLLPLTKWRLGASVVGMVALAPFYIGIALALGHKDIYSGLIAAVAIGGVAGYGISSGSEKSKDSL